MILVDTSCWIEVLRERGDAAVRRRIHDLVHAGQASWSPVVRLELWNGARGVREKNVLLEFEQVLPELDMPVEVWDVACDLARRARAAGLTIPATDLLIAACARHHGVEIDSTDAHFAELGKL
ncbi:MAG: PIN domain-containing protein [Opitutus sp.]|nr:PIN domain-containing protein [Opitutus sp.]